jgi:hypothetical protein
MSLSEIFSPEEELYLATSANLSASLAAIPKVS